MSDILQQDEVDALLEGMDSGSVDTTPQKTESPAEIRNYDFSTQSRIVRGRMPTLEAINERLARSLRSSISNMIGRSPEVAVAGISTPTYREYVATLSVPTSLNLIRLTPLTGTGLIVFESRLVSALIDIYFGGSGRPAKIEGRDFTPTETQVIKHLLDQVIEATRAAWSPLLAVTVEFMNRETNPNYVNIVTPTDIVVVNRLSVELGGKSGEIHIMLPYAMLEPLKDTLRATMSSGRAEHEDQWSQLLRNELEESEVDLMTNLGSARVTVESLIDMKPGDVIPCSFDGRATVTADGVPLFWGELGQQRGQQVVKVSKLNVRKLGNALDAFMRAGE
jgi:flagellar motor switch protein FliM